MAFNTDYTSFRTAVPRFIDWTDSTTTHVDDLIAVAERKVYKLLRSRANEFRYSLTAASDGTVAVPADYEEMKSARIDANPVKRLTRVPLEEIYDKYANRQAGSERVFAREGDVFIFGPAGASGDVMKGVYYRSGTSMATAATINSIFSAHPELFLMACAAESIAYIGANSRIPLWEAKFKELLAIANGAAKDEENSGSSLYGRLG